LPDDGIPEPPAQTRDDRRAGGGAPFRELIRDARGSKSFPRRCLFRPDAYGL